MCMYDSILNNFVQRSQYRGIKFPLNKKFVVNKCMLIKEFRVSFSGFNVTKVKIATFHYDSSPNDCLHLVHAQFESKILNGIY